jgi:hypothetical protein
MPIIVNELEVVAPPSNSEETPLESSPTDKGTILNPHDLYWIKRKLTERQIRLATR